MRVIGVGHDHRLRRCCNKGRDGCDLRHTRTSCVANRGPLVVDLIHLIRAPQPTAKECMRLGRCPGRLRDDGHEFCLPTAMKWSLIGDHQGANPSSEAVGFSVGGHRLFADSTW